MFLPFCWPMHPEEELQYSAGLQKDSRAATGVAEASVSPHTIAAITIRLLIFFMLELRHLGGGR